MDRQIALQCYHQLSESICSKCGSWEYQHQIYTIKTQIYSNIGKVNWKVIYNNLKSRKVKIITNFKYDCIKVCNFLSKITHKYSLGLECLALAIYLYQNISEPQPSKLQSTALSCLSLCNKLINSVKNNNNPLKYLKNYSKIIKMEQSLLLELIKIQKGTFVTFLNLYLSIGVVLSNEISDQNKNRIAQIQESILSIADLYIQSGRFLNYDPQFLAIHIVKNVRQKYKMNIKTNILGIIIENQKWQSVQTIINNQDIQNNILDYNKFNQQKYLQKFRIFLSKQFITDESPLLKKQMNIKQQQKNIQKLISINSTDCLLKKRKLSNNQTYMKLKQKILKGKDSKDILTILSYPIIQTQTQNYNSIGICSIKQNVKKQISKSKQLQKINSLRQLQNKSKLKSIYCLKQNQKIQNKNKNIIHNKIIINNYRQISNL